MSSRYSQSKALWAVTKASFKAIFTHPSAIFFGLLFPIVFILIFGAFGGGGGSSYKIAFDNASDSTSDLYLRLANNPVIRVQKFADSTALNNALLKGKITAILFIQEKKDSLGRAHFNVAVQSTSASNNTLPSFMQVLDYIRLRFEMEQLKSVDKENFVTLQQPIIKEVRPYRQIDFILPGQIGFSILFSTLFGIAFTFYTLREQFVLKRFYASPINRINILIGIGVSRLFFQLLNVVLLILIGHFFLNFTLQHGFLTFLEMLLMVILMLFLLMGVGLIFGSVSKTDTSIPLLINLFGFPQMLLSGTFFSLEVFPKWLQQICFFWPLTQFNNAMRKIAFEGLSVFDCWTEIGILAVWMLIVYAILKKVIKWQ